MDPPPTGHEYVGARFFGHRIEFFYVEALADPSVSEKTSSSRSKLPGQDFLSHNLVITDRNYTRDFHHTNQACRKLCRLGERTGLKLFTVSIQKLILYMAGHSLA